MDDIVALRVDLTDGASLSFVTWGRIQEEVDPDPLEALVMQARGDGSERG